MYPTIPHVNVTYVDYIHSQCMYDCNRPELEGGEWPSMREALFKHEIHTSNQPYLMTLSILHQRDIQLPRMKSMCDLNMLKRDAYTLM
jgi:hypothetical protein